MMAVYLPDTKIEEALPEDEEDRRQRPKLGSIYYNAEAGHWVAADGYILAIVPALDHEAASAMIPHDAWEDIRRAKAEAVDIDNDAHQAVLVLGGGAQIRRYRLTEGGYIKYQSIIPEFEEGDEGTITLALDAKKLWRLAQAIRKPDEHYGDYGLRITIALNDVSSPVRVEPLERDSDCIGVIMPMHIPCLT